MITCRQLAELLIEYVSDELPPDMRANLDSHLCLCQPCMIYLETYRLTIRLTRQLPPQPLPPPLVERLRAALEEIRKPRSEPGAC